MALRSIIVRAGTHIDVPLLGVRLELRYAPQTCALIVCGAVGAFFMLGERGWLGHALLTDGEDCPDDSWADEPPRNGGKKRRGGGGGGRGSKWSGATVGANPSLTLHLRPVHCAYRPLFGAGR